MSMISPLVEKYITAFSSPESAELAAISQSTKNDHPAAHMLSGHIQGQLLYFLSCLLEPKFILEIGTFTGYSAICLAKGLAENGELHTIELRADDAATAASNFSKFNQNKQVTLHIGNAKDIIAQLPHKWDLVFIDADKTGYIDYYELVLPRLSKNGIIIADNVLFHGQVLEETITGKNAKAIHAFNQHVQNDPRTEQVLLSVRDGIMIIKKTVAQMKILYTMLGLIGFFWCNAQNEKTVAYINQYKEIAMQEMSRSGVPASITLAQAVLESQSGESVLVKKSNNHFGIKCKVEWTGAKVYHNDDAKGECFRAYTSAEKSFQDHSDFLKTRPHYAFLFYLSPMDYEAWAYGLKKAGYATAPTYPQKLIKVITDYNLNQYNIIAIAKAKEQSPVTQDVKIIVAASKPINNNINAIAQPDAAELTDDREEVPLKIVTTKKNIIASNSNPSPYPSGIFLNNELKVIYASKGTSMLALANEYHITLSKLLSFNDMDEIDILCTNQLIYLERKQKKGITDFYISKSGESIYQIAQITGVRIENILAYNNKFRKLLTVPTGSKIWLNTPTESSPTANKK